MRTRIINGVVATIHIEDAQLKLRKKQRWVYKPNGLLMTFAHR